MESTVKERGWANFNSLILQTYAPLEGGSGGPFKNYLTVGSCEL